MPNTIKVLVLEANLDGSALLGITHLSTDVHERLHEMYRLIHCTCVTCVEIEVDGEYFDLWCDDEGLLKPCPVPSLYVEDGIVIHGGFIISRYNEDGGMESLSQEDIERLSRYIGKQRMELRAWIEERK